MAMPQDIGKPGNHPKDLTSDQRQDLSDRAARGAMEEQRRVMTAAWENEKCSRGHLRVRKGKCLACGATTQEKELREKIMHILNNVAAAYGGKPRTLVYKDENQCNKLLNLIARERSEDLKAMEEAEQVINDLYAECCSHFVPPIATSSPEIQKGRLDKADRVLSALRSRLP